jgi:hypothetical protein
VPRAARQRSLEERAGVHSWPDRACRLKEVIGRLIDVRAAVSRLDRFRAIDEKARKACLL